MLNIAQNTSEFIEYARTSRALGYKVRLWHTFLYFVHSNFLKGPKITGGAELPRKVRLKFSYGPTDHLLTGFCHHYALQYFCGIHFSV